MNVVVAFTVLVKLLAVDKLSVTAPPVPNAELVSL